MIREPPHPSAGLERLDSILGRVFADMDRRVTCGEQSASPSPARSTTSTAEALVARLLDDGLDLVEVVEMLGEAFRIAGERAIERRHLGAVEAEQLRRHTEAT